MILTSFWWRGCEPRRTAQGTKRNGAAGNHITHVRRDQSPMGRMGRGRKRVATLLLTCYIQLEWCVRMWSDERGGKYVIVFLLFRSRGVSRKEVDRLRANSSVAERSAPRNAVDRMRANLRTYVRRDFSFNLRVRSNAGASRTRTALWTGKPKYVRTYSAIHWLHSTLITAHRRSLYIRTYAGRRGSRPHSWMSTLSNAAHLRHQEVDDGIRTTSAGQLEEDSDHHCGGHAGGVSQAAAGGSNPGGVGPAAAGEYHTDDVGPASVRCARLLVTLVPVVHMCSVERCCSQYSLLRRSRFSDVPRPLSRSLHSGPRSGTPS
jgi:hypothetical protein